MAITTSIATNVSKKYSKSHPSLPPNSPEVLMVGFRAGGWTLFAAAAMSIIIGLVGLRGIGIVGRQKTSEEISDNMIAEDGGEKNADNGVKEIVLESSV